MEILFKKYRNFMEVFLFVILGEVKYLLYIAEIHLQFHVCHKIFNF